jgi:hypothetical protein
MFQLQNGIEAEARKDGVAGNSRLTAALGAILLVLSRLRERRFRSSVNCARSTS